MQNLLKALKYCKSKSKLQKKVVVQDNSKQIQKLENKINKLKDLYLDDLIDKETYIKDYKMYTSQLDNLKLEVVVEQERDFSKIEKILNSDYVSIYSNLSLENKRRFWLSIIDRVTILDGKVKEITFLT